MSGGHTRQRTRVVAGEAHGAARESVEVGCRELAAAIASEHVPVQAVEQYDDCVFWLYFGYGIHGCKLAGCATKSAIETSALEIRTRDDVGSRRGCARLV